MGLNLDVFMTDGKSARGGAGACCHTQMTFFFMNANECVDICHVCGYEQLRFLFALTLSYCDT
jgi:hypothetical protein